MPHWPPTTSELDILRERFWKYVNPTSPQECWVWRGAKTKGGYGHLLLRGRVDGVKWEREFLAHRLSLCLAGYALRKEDHALHSCDNPPCCNPNHLRAGTDMDNVRDCISRGRKPRVVGEQCGAAKLRAEQVLQIRSLLSEKRGATDVARAFGVSPSLIRRIAAREIWTHL